MTGTSTGSASCISTGAGQQLLSLVVEEGVWAGSESGSEPGLDGGLLARLLVVGVATGMEDILRFTGVGRAEGR